ncbi:MAG: hypothetical protein ACTSR3_20825 [Candidatus Helarchaeota archaeon]
MAEARTESEKIIELINDSPRAKKILTAENWNVIFQFELETEPEPFYIEVKDGKAILKDGKHPNPTMLITGDGEGVARASRGQGDFTHAISREQIEVKKGKVMELIRYGRAINAALKDKK